MNLLSLRRLEAILETDRLDLRRFAYQSAEYYSQFDLRKTATDKWRHVDNPALPLKIIQKKICREILSTVQLPIGIQGGIRGRSIKSNASVHVGQKEVASLDLKNCFYRTKYRKILNVFHELFGCSSENAELLANLTTYERRLPVGASTSPLLSALVLLPTYQIIQEKLKSHGVNVSIWVDDIVMSGERAFRFVPLVTEILQHAGYEVHAGKLRKMNQAVCQMAPGAVVNNKLSVGRSRMRAIRNEIFDLGKLPTASVSVADLQRVRSKIVQVRYICETQGEALMRCAERYLPKTAQRPSIKRAMLHRECSSWRRDHTHDS